LLLLAEELGLMVAVVVVVADLEQALH